MENPQASRSEIEPLAQRYRIRLILAFGSSVGGATHAHSDLDLGVLLADNNMTLDERSRLVHDLQQIYPGREIDLAVLNHADPLFLKKVTERCRLIFGVEEDLHHLRIYAYRRYQDHRRYLDMERKFTRDFVARIGSGS